MIGEFCQRLCLCYTHPDRKPGIAVDRIFQLMPELFQHTAITYTSEVSKGLVDAVDFNSGRHLLQCRHDPVAHIGVEFIVRTEANHAMPAELVFAFEIRIPHLYAELLGFSGARYHTTIVIGQYDNWLPSQIRPENGFSARIEAVHINQSKHYITGLSSKPALLMM